MLLGANIPENRCIRIAKKSNVLDLELQPVASSHVRRCSVDVTAELHRAVTEYCHQMTPEAVKTFAKSDIRFHVLISIRMLMLSLLYLTTCRMNKAIPNPSLPTAEKWMEKLLKGDECVLHFWLYRMFQ